MKEINDETNVLRDCRNVTFRHLFIFSGSIFSAFFFLPYPFSYIKHTWTSCYPYYSRLGLKIPYVSRSYTFLIARMFLWIPRFDFSFFFLNLFLDRFHLHSYFNPNTLVTSWVFPGTSFFPWNSDQGPNIRF